MTIENTETGTRRGTAVTLVFIDREQLLLDLVIGALQSDSLKVYGATDTDRGAQLVQMYSPIMVVVDAGVPNVLAFVEWARKENPSGKFLATVDSDALRETCVAAGMEAAIADKRQGFDAFMNAMQRSVGASVPLMPEDGKVRILVVDDEEEIRTIIASFLGRLGYAVTAARNGYEAIEFIAMDPSIALVLMDISMPGMGGLETLRRIVSRKPHPAVIMATGVADRDVGQQALKIGASDYILKPFDLNSVESSITFCLNQAAYQKQPWWKRLKGR